MCKPLLAEIARENVIREYFDGHESSNAQYYCDRCGYTTNFKKHMKQHLIRMTKCIPVLNSDITVDDVNKKYFDTKGKLKCEADGCNKYFVTAKTRRNHYKTCALMHAQKDYEEHRTDSKELGELSIYEPHAEPPSVDDESCSAITSNTYMANGAHSIIHVNSGNTTTNVTQHITINAFGSESSDHIAADTKFMRRCLALKKYGIMDYIVRKYFDPEHPENRTIRRSAKKDPHIQCFNGTQFESRLASDVHETITTGFEADLMEFLDGLSEEGKVLKPQSTLRHFMKDIGYPLGIDLSPHEGGLEQESYLNETKLQTQKRAIHRLMSARVYEQETQQQQHK
jgi:hypothetical protein